MQAGSHTNFKKASRYTITPKSKSIRSPLRHCQTLEQSGPQLERDPARYPISCNYGHHDTNVVARVACAVAILPQHSLAGNLALVGKLRDVHALAGIPAPVGAVGELVDHHAFKDVLLVVPIMKNVFVKDVQDGWLNYFEYKSHVSR